MKKSSKLNVALASAAMAGLLAGASARADTSSALRGVEGTQQLPTKMGCSGNGCSSKGGCSGKTPPAKPANPPATQPAKP